jgi:hypothetical protein
MVFRKLASLATLLLAACSPAADAPEPEPSATFSPSDAYVVMPPPPIVEGEGEVPFAFRGIWDWTGGACEEASDMLMKIGPSGILFYESVGTVEELRMDGDTLSLDLAMEGEGEQWQQTTVLKLVQGGNQLESTHEDPSGTGPLRYKRCPGGNVD